MSARVAKSTIYFAKRGPEECMALHAQDTLQNTLWLTAEMLWSSRMVWIWYPRHHYSALALLVSFDLAPSKYI
jgi:hypothetical protein